MRSPRIESASGVSTLTSSNFRAIASAETISAVSQTRSLRSIFFQLKRCFFRQATQPPDDFGGAPIVFQNISDDILEFSDVGARGIQDHVCGFSVSHNQAEWLVDFMSNGGKFACRRGAVDM